MTSEILMTSNTYLTKSQGKRVLDYILDFLIKYAKNAVTVAQLSLEKSQQATIQHPEWYKCINYAVLEISIT